MVTFSGHCSRAHCTPARWSLLVTLQLDPRLTLTSPSQRPTHSGSIFRLLLKIAVGLPRSCDSSQFLQGFGPNSNQSKTWCPSLCAARPAIAGVTSSVELPQLAVAPPLSLLFRRKSSQVGRILTRPQVFGRTSTYAPVSRPPHYILAVGAEALSMTPSGDALFAS